MIRFKTIILKFQKQGEKTGWTYIEVAADLAQQLKPGNKKTFRVKGKLDGYSFQQVALLPMGNGSFIMALNAMFDGYQPSQTRVVLAASSGACSSIH